jgi:excisionase family DNA binding protein
MRVKEAANRLEVGISTVYALCDQGLLPHVRVGLGRGTIRISEDDLRVFLEKCRNDRKANASDGGNRVRTI